MNSFNAEYGRTGSWFTNITIRSGTNALHGSVYDYFDNDALNARSFFQSSRSIVRHHEGGFTRLPIHLPKIYDGRRIRLSFFFGQQLVYYTNTNSGRSLYGSDARISAAEISAALVDNTNTQIPIFDPGTTQPDGRGGFMRTQFPGNRFQATGSARFPRRFWSSSHYRTFLRPQLNNFRNRTGSGTYRNYVSTLKIDHSFSTKHKISITYSDQYNPRVIAGRGYGVDSPLEGSQSPKMIHDRTGRINYDWIMRPNLLNHYDRRRPL